MILKIKKLTISNFKGVSSRTIDFTDKTTICGANGTGKTTIADAWYWLIAGKDSTITDNPNVVPIGMTEANPSVSAECDIDGKPVSIKKVQTYKNKDGKETTSNQYFVNDVPLTEKDYKAKMETYGVDFDKLLVLSHPDYLLRDTSKKGREYVRNEILFPMGQSVTDKEIADKNGLKDLSAQLDNYSLVEIEKMQKAVLTKINKEIGKDNSIANARIDELIRNKKGLNCKGIKKQIDELKAKINNNQQAQKEVAEKIEKYRQDILKMSFDRNAIVSAQNDERTAKRFSLRDLLFETNNALTKAKNEVEHIKVLIETDQETIKASESRIKHLNREIEEENHTCPSCGQQMPESVVKAFVKAAKDDIKDQEEIIEKRKTELATLYGNLDGATKMTHKFKEEVDRIANEIQDIETNKPELPTPAMYLDNKIAEANQQISILEDNNLKEVERNLYGQMATLDCEYAKAFSDEMTDSRIADIKEEIKKAEINRANAEKLIYQIEQLNQAKNEMLEDSINNHFSLVKWKLFRTLKNGNIEDSCLPTIDGFELGTSANRGRETLCKLDIIAGLQKFYGMNYPVFVDNFESVSNDTANRISTDCQLVIFKVTEDKELKEE